MARADEGLAFLLRYENVAWYEDGAVRILDRRVYPRRIEFVTCTTHEQVRDAIRDMVTQSCGPFTACAAGMALAAWECRDRSREAQWEYLCRAAETISHARPTTVSRYARITGGCLQAAREALDKGLPVDKAIVDQLIRANDRRYSRVGEIAKYLVEKIPQHGTIMTQCFGETIVGMMCREIQRQGKQVRVFCPETRPYFQGARLTATVCSEMGLDTTVITDNMPAFVMEREGVDLFTCAADAICLDGCVVNKIGTCQIAIAANYRHVPVYVTGVPDQGHPDGASVHIELRGGEFVLQAMGVPTAAPGVKGYYPSFDVTPPELITGIVTDLGIYPPTELRDYLARSEIGPFELIV